MTKLLFLRRLTKHLVLKKLRKFNQHFFKVKGKKWN